jgi:hydrogenase maturation protease
MTSVLGLGNVLMGDDGLGPAVVRAFEAEYVVGPGVEVIDLGTPGLDLLPWLADVDRVVIVDAVKSDLPPGTVRIYDKEDILRHAPSVRVGPHDPGVKEALVTLEFAGRGPRDVTLIGVVPATNAMSLELSASVQAAIPSVLEQIARVLARGGTPARRRSRAEASPSCWPYTTASTCAMSGSG